MIFGRQICKLCKQLPDKLRVHTIPAKKKIWRRGWGRHGKKTVQPGDAHSPTIQRVMQNWNLTTARVANICHSVESSISKEREKESKAA
jgi:hypothetical protein